MVQEISESGHGGSINGGVGKGLGRGRRRLCWSGASGQVTHVIFVVALAVKDHLVIFGDRNDVLVDMCFTIVVAELAD